MPYEKVEIPLFSGLEQKSDDRVTSPGSLTIAENVEYDKEGALNKRKGYSSGLDTTDAVGNTIEQTLMEVATLRDELVVFGYDTVYSLGSKDGSLPSTRYTLKRGPIARGNIKVTKVITGRAGGDPINAVPE